MKVCLKKYGADLNGTIYTKEELQDAVNKIDRELLGTLKPMHPIDLRDTAFRIHNLTLEDDGLYGEIDILETPAGNTLKAILPSTRFSLVGTGVVQPDDTVADYNISSVCTIVD